MEEPGERRKKLRRQAEQRVAEQRREPISAKGEGEREEGEKARGEGMRKEEREGERREGRRRRGREREEMEGGRERSQDPAGFALTRVVHVQFVHYPLVAAAKHHDEFLDGHGSVAVAGPGHWTRPAHHSLPARLQEHRWRVGGRHGRSHSSRKGRGGKKSPSGKGAPQFLSHTPLFV